MAKFFVTTAIPYVNDKPHLGHAMEFTQADVLARYWRAQGADVLFGTGTDEHGGKVYETAQKAGLEPQKFVDSITGVFQQLCKTLNVQYDKFVRTTDKAHIQAAQTLWQQLAKDIYKGKYKGFYCTGCEKFISPQEAKANKGVCPDHNRPYEQIEEENYFFKLSKYSKTIAEIINKDQLRIIPLSRKHEILALLERGLDDISFSRPKAKLPWGIPVPGDAEHVMYVWPEALTNYLTASGYPATDFKKWWPADLHIIGKDILRFHAGIWPAMLLAAGLELPKAIYAHGFINIDGKKMSKSLGNAVDPFEVIENFGADPFRYYLLHEIPSEDDGNFSLERLQQVYNSDLANDLGNLVQRTATMVTQYQKGVVGEIPSHSHDVKPYQEAMTNLRFDRAIDEVWLLVKGLNQYVDEEKPWELAKDKDNEHLGEVLAYLVSNILQVGRLLEPFMPTTAARIAATFKDGVVHPEVGLLFPKSQSKVEGPSSPKQK